MSDVTLYHGDCLEILPTLAAGSVDAIITDIPYGTTACSWDEVIPFDAMWCEVKRVTNTFITTASQPFTSKLVMSNLEWFKYEWIWEKDKSSNFGVAKYRPLNISENILAFINKKNTYNPQMWDSGKKSNKGGKIKNIKGVYGDNGFKWSYRNTTIKYPVNVVKFNTPKHNDKDNGALHPTQKPVKLYEYLIRTYTNEGDTVLDITMGSGTTGVACVQTGRNFIGIELDKGYYEIAEKRIKEAQLQIRMEI